MHTKVLKITPAPKSILLNSGIGAFGAPSDPLGDILKKLPGAIRIAFLFICFYEALLLELSFDSVELIVHLEVVVDVAQSHQVLFVLTVQLHRLLQEG